MHAASVTEPRPLRRWADKGGKRVYALLFYDMPQISAKMVAAMDEFMHVYVARDRKRTK